MTRAEKTFQEALAALNQRRIHDAERLFRELVKAQPKHVAALNLLSVVLMSMERFAEAEEFIERAVKLNQNSDASFYNYGMILKRLGKSGQAKLQLDKALQLNSKVYETWNGRGTIFNDLKQYEQAISDFDRAASLNPNGHDAICNKGKSLLALKRYDEAFAAYDKALTLKPDLAEAWLGRGNVSAELKRYDDALVAYDKALAFKPDLVEAWLGRGNVFIDLKRYDAVFAAYDKVLALKPDLPEVWLGRGNVSVEVKRYNDALAAYDKALALKPDWAEAWLGRGNVSTDLKRYDEAVAAYDKALTLKPDLAEAWLGRGNLFRDLKRYDEAVAAYDKALVLKPDLAEAWLGRGNVFTGLDRYDEAFSAYKKALEVKPGLAEAWLGCGAAFADLKRYDEAFAACDKALALKPDLAEAWLGRGTGFADLNRYDEAFAAYDKAAALKPDLEYAEAARLDAKMQLCDWRNFETECGHLLSSIENGTVSRPFTLLAASPSPEVQLKSARLLAKKVRPASDASIWQGGRYEHDRIRIAYLSADFGEHPVSFLLAGMFEQHDRNRFETFGVSFGSHNSSEMLTRLKNSFDQFMDVKNRSDLDVVGLLRELEVDIAVDLMGHTKNSRTPIFALRASPIQINYLGYPGTMGATYIDYIVVDRFLIPDAQRQFYDEKIIYLPDTFQANDSKREIDRAPVSRAEAGLPEKAFVFCAFNSSQKIAPLWFDIWMRLLHKIDGSVLWLLGDDGNRERNLRQQAENRGISSSRLVFANRLPYARYLARYRLADLFLDTFPFNAGTTASDALWTGLPLITYPGETFASRMAGSLLTAVGLPEMIVESASDYETLACKLASNPDRMASIKQKLAANLSSCSLFNTKLFTRHIEAAYTAAYERYQDGLPPADIRVPTEAGVSTQMSTKRSN